jgi:hypothetical protein
MMALSIFITSFFTIFSTGACGSTCSDSLLFDVLSARFFFDNENILREYTPQATITRFL